MTTACLLLMSSVVGQMSYYPQNGYFPGYTNGYFPGYANGYYNNRIPLQYYDPIRYARYYEGSGFYTYTPPPIADSEIINLRPPATTSQPAANSQPAATSQPAANSQPGMTGLVLAVNEPQKSITLQLPTGTTAVSYGPYTHFLASDGNFPVIKPGNLINVNQNTITILKRSEQ